MYLNKSKYDKCSEKFEINTIKKTLKRKKCKVKILNKIKILKFL